MAYSEYAQKIGPAQPAPEDFGFPLDDETREILHSIIIKLEKAAAAAEKNIDLLNIEMPYKLEIGVVKTFYPGERQDLLPFSQWAKQLSGEYLQPESLEQLFFFDFLQQFEDKLIETGHCTKEDFFFLIMPLTSDNVRLKPLFHSLKMVAQGIYYEHIEVAPELAATSYNAAAEQGFMDGVYYYIRYVLRKHPKLTKDSIETRKALHYLVELRNKLYPAADDLAFEILDRNWDVKAEAYRPTSMSFLSQPMIENGKLAHLTYKFNQLTPQKVSVTCTELPENFQTLHKECLTLLGEKHPLCSILEAELWQLCFCKQTIIDKEPRPQHFCAVQACKLYRQAIWAAKAKTDLVYVSWAMSELKKIVLYCQNPGKQNAMIIVKNESKMIFTRPRNYSVGAHYNPLELGMCRYYYLTLQHSINPGKTVPCYGDNVLLSHLICNDMRDFPLVWILALAQDYKLRPRRLVHIEKSKKEMAAPMSPLDILIFLFKSTCPHKQQYLEKMLDEPPQDARAEDSREIARRSKLSQLEVAKSVTVSARVSLIDDREDGQFGFGFGPESGYMGILSE